MKYDHLIRLAPACVLAVIFSLSLFANASTPEIPINDIIAWLVFTCACGFMLNATREFPLKSLLLLAILPACIPLILVLYMVFFLRRTIFVSSVESNDPRFVPFMLFLTAVCYLGIWLFSYSREFLTTVASWANDKASQETVKRIAVTIQVTVGAAGSIFLTLKALGKI